MGAKYPFIYVTNGMTIRVLRDNLHYGFYFYRCIRPGQYIYSYDYQLEEQWLTEDDSHGKHFLGGDSFTFDEDSLPPEGEGYIRLYEEVGKKAELCSKERIAEIFLIQHPEYSSWRDAERDVLQKKTDAFLAREDVQAEVKDTARKAAGYGDRLLFACASDSHYVINGNWKYTAATLNAVLRGLEESVGKKADGVIHLGDFTDGILSRDICRNYSHRVIGACRELGFPMYLCIGNHDANYFRSNPDIMDEKEQWQMYMDDSGVAKDLDIVSRQGLCYLAKTSRPDVKILVLSAYDNSKKNRYGYSLKDIAWAKEQLAALPSNEKVVILSHDAPLSKLDFWAKEIRNGTALCDMLDDWNEARSGKGILALFHGHTHADFICADRSFPIISIGCSKIEYFEDRKPPGALAPVRCEGDVTQELWDMIAIDPQSGAIDMIRFGAGYDRHINGWDHSDDNRYYSFRKNCHHRLNKPLIWAHRGASGYAPENTLAAFELAAAFGADGVELDVQFTKDRQLVVIHDETIDRTSDGHGAVAQMTLEELRKYNYNRTHPAFGWCDILLLSEVLTILAPTGMSVNIELKTGINPYPGIEEKTIQLVNEYGMMDRVIFSSFSHASMARVKAIAPEAVCGLLYSNGIMDAPKYALGVGMDALHPAVYNVKEPFFMDKAKALGIKVHVWTANSEDDLLRLQQIGVDAVITNYPDRAREIYEGIKLDAIRKKLLLSRLSDAVR